MTVLVEQIILLLLDILILVTGTLVNLILIVWVDIVVSQIQLGQTLVKVFVWEEVFILEIQNIFAIRQNGILSNQFKMFLV